MKSLKKIVSGYKQSQKIGIINLDNDKCVGWVHVNCGKFSNLDYGNNWIGLPIKSFEYNKFEALNLEPCSICSEYKN
jgi:hypothetical protein